MQLMKAIADTRVCALKEARNYHAAYHNEKSAYKVKKALIQLLDAAYNRLNQGVTTAESKTVSIEII